MSENQIDVPFLSPAMLGKWVVERFDIWQMGFLSDQELGRLASDLGLMSLSLGDHVKQLWQLGLLRADVVESTQPLAIEGLTLVHQNGTEQYYYVDERTVAHQDKGLGGEIAKLQAFPAYI